MGFLRIHCKRCGNVWSVYHRDNWNDDNFRHCPFCFSEIDEGLWKKQILPAFGAMSDANREIENHYTGYLTGSLFRVDYISNPVMLRGNE